MKELNWKCNLQQIIDTILIIEMGEDNMVLTIEETNWRAKND